jgi:hypothetical protein
LRYQVLWGLLGILGADIADIHSIRRYRMNLVQLA